MIMLRGSRGESYGLTLQRCSLDEDGVRRQVEIANLAIDCECCCFLLQYIVIFFFNTRFHLKFSFGFEEDRIGQGRQTASLLFVLNRSSSSSFNYIFVTKLQEGKLENFIKEISNERVKMFLGFLNERRGSQECKEFNSKLPFLMTRNVIQSFYLYVHINKQT